MNRLCSEIAGEEEWAFVNVNVRPFYAEGSKTLGYEVAEQLGWRLPRAGRRPDRRRLAADQGRQGVHGARPARAGRAKPYAVFGAQAAGCSPVSTAFRDGTDAVTPVKPTTIAKSLAIGNPADGPYALDGRPPHRRRDRATSPTTRSSTGIRLLAPTEGVFAETAGGVTVALLRKLLPEGRLDPAAETVVFNTGDGLKTIDAVASVAVPTATIKPSYGAFCRAGLA